MNAEEILRDMLCDYITDPGEFIAEFKRRVDQPLDGKFSGYVWRNRDGAVESHFMVFVPRDKCMLLMLEAYFNACKSMGCDPEQLSAIQRIMQRVDAWQLENATKLPDAAPGECK